MRYACAPILVGVAPLVSEILPLFVCQTHNDIHSTTPPTPRNAHTLTHFLASLRYWKSSILTRVSSASDALS